MFDLLFLTSTSETAASKTPQYTDIEIYFWYIALVIMIIITIIFIRNDASDKKKMSNLASEVNKKHVTIDNLLNDEKLDKNKIKNFSLTTIGLLDNADVLFIELKEKTRLDDFVKILDEKGVIVKELKDINNSSLENAKKQLELVKDQLIVFKGQLELLITLIK